MFSSVSLVDDPHKDPDPDIPASYCIKIYDSLPDQFSSKSQIGC